MSNDESIPKIQIDTGWKAEAQAEKERLALKEQQSAQTAQSSAPATGTAADGSKPGQKLPPADFRGLVGMLASQAIMGLGAMAEPKTNRVIIDLEGAQFAIDMLGLIEEKTKGNLSKEEETELRQVLVELRARYVQITQLLAQQAPTSDEANQAPILTTPPHGL